MVQKHFVVVSDRFAERAGSFSELDEFVGTFGPCRTIGPGKLADYRWQDVLATIVDVDLSDDEQVQTLIGKIPSRPELRSLFIVDRSYRSAAQAFSLGASEIFRFRTDQDELGAALSGLNDQPVGTADASDLVSSVLSARQVLGDLFEAARRDRPIDIKALCRAGESIDLAIGRSGMIGWLRTVRQHHQGTYQHCLLVAGVTVSFAQALGFSCGDRYRLAKAALVHDVGKACVPTAILDKPGRLSEKEMETIRTHAATGADLLLKHHPDESELIDVTRHHHEMLDGSGYPDGLAGDEISDPVRMLTVCDIYSALMETRSYKPPFSREKAVGILLEMGGKLDRTLLMPFVEFVGSSENANVHS